MAVDLERAGCLVTGVAGFVGSHLAERLLALNHTVIGVDNFFSGFEENIAHLRGSPGFHFYNRSIAESGLMEALKESHPELKYCFHLAAVVSVPYSMDHPEETLDVNYRATVTMLKEAARLGIEAFVFAGSAAEYGDDQRLPLLEEYATEGTKHLSPYGRAKFLASGAVSSSPVGVALRCFNIYGPRQDPGSPYSGVISKFVDMALKREPLPIFGDGLQTRDFIYVADIVEAYAQAAGLLPGRARIPSGIYNVGMGRSTSVLELAETVLEVTAQPRRLVFQPERPGDIRYSVASIDRLRGASTWIPEVSLHEGLSKTVEWTQRDAKRLPSISRLQ